MALSSKEVAAKLSELERLRVDEATTISFQGLDWIVLPDVFQVQMSSASTFAWEVLQELEPVDSFLDLGCGPGNNLVVALKTGLCRRATGTDVTPNAVESARLNAERHGVGENADFIVSDMFDSLTDQRFDLIFWNGPPGMEAAEAVELSDHERSFYDLDYDCNTRFFTQARRHLTPSGRLMIGFCRLGNFDRVSQIASEAGFDGKVVAERTESHGHWLVEFTDK